MGVSVALVPPATTEKSGALDAPVDDGQRWIAQARTELALYFAGRLRAFAVTLAPQGTPFQEAGASAPVSATMSVRKSISRARASG